MGLAYTAEPSVGVCFSMNERRGMSQITRDSAWLALVDNVKETISPHLDNLGSCLLSCSLYTSCLAIPSLLYSLSNTTMEKVGELNISSEHLESQDEHSDTSRQPATTTTTTIIAQMTEEHKNYILKRHKTLDLDPMPSTDPNEPYNWPRWKV